MYPHLLLSGLAYLFVINGRTDGTIGRLVKFQNNVNQMESLNSIGFHTATSRFHDEPNKFVSLKEIAQCTFPKKDMFYSKCIVIKDVLKLVLLQYSFSLIFNPCHLNAYQSFSIGSSLIYFTPLSKGFDCSFNLVMFSHFLYG